MEKQMKFSILRPDQNDQGGAESATASDERDHLNRAFSTLPPDQKSFRTKLL